MSEFVPGLEGVVAFETQIAEPDREGGALRYRGVDIEDLVGRVSYGQVWGLLVDAEFNPGLPPAEPFPIPIHSGDIRVDVQAAIATLAPAWGLRPLLDIDDDEARENLAHVSVMAMSFVAQSARGLGLPMVPQHRIDEARTVVERFMIRWRGEPDPKHVQAVDAYFVSAAEHGMNASTFTARVIASTGADVAAAISGAVGAMSGPLHGGAPSRVLGMIEEIERTGDAKAYVKAVLDKGSGTGSTVPRTPVRASCAAQRRSSAHRATRSPWPWSRRPSRSCGPGDPTGSWRPTSSSGRRSSSTSPRCRRTCSRPCSPAPDWPAGARTSSSRRAPAG
jgi:citrate synthase